MKKKTVSLIAGSIFACGLLVPAASALAADNYGPPKKVTKWVFQPCFDSSEAGWSKGVVPWIEAVEKATEGTIKIDLEPAGAITSGSEAFGATSMGMIDVYAGWATVYGGDMPEGMLAYGMAMGLNSTEQSWDIMWGDENYRVGDIIQKAAHERNVHWAGWSNQGPNAAFTTFPVRSIEDFKGKKMRAGGPQALFHAAMGGAPVAMGGGDIYTAIKLGTIEGTYWDTGGIDDMAFNEVIKYATMPGWTPAQHQEIFINLDRWNDLNKWQQDKITEVFKSNYFETSAMMEGAVTEALDVLKASGGEVITLPAEEVKKMRDKSMAEVWPKVAEKSDACATGVEKFKQYMTEKGLM